MPAPAELLARLTPHGQQHAVGFWDDLTEGQQSKLAAQLAAVDLEQLGELYRGDADQPDWAELARTAEPPVAMRLSDREAGQGGGLGVTPDQASERGKQTLDAGEVGVLLVAGGQGSRLGFDHPKGVFPIGPVSGATLLQIHLEKAVALAKRHGVGVPVYLMTSPITHDEQVKFLEENNRFGLAEDDLFVFCQGTMPAVDKSTGKMLLADKGELFLSPDGHGGTIAALASSGATEHMRRRGVKQLFYLQVDNPIVPIGDAEMLGYHLLAESELTSMAVTKQAPEDKLGNFVMLGDELNVIEYSDFPSEVAAATDDAGGLKFWAGSIAVHVFDVAFLERMLALKDALPFHIANKKVPHVCPERGETVEPTEPNALKFERFIFDLLPKAQNPIVVEYAEEEVFAPLKNAPGAPKDTAEYVQLFMQNQHRRWLEAAGRGVAEGVTVEVSPLYGLDAEGVAERVAADGSQDQTIDRPTYLC
ncbi:putative uridylyltransferase [Pseudobythopirellula maris]|uniref:Putative uridylyltransferase n=1 Tax=Pseudobythopirellula maris TaxID=2527991 RepID=A0A5C5ZHP6_9BACT|nr:UTP--glucose-1-phosphate uridylyltransferase [Pseudobythopirellula maris]TWT86874.1 putative uridylyltransferase [Pseudobythopirellula maris]